MTSHSLTLGAVALCCLVALAAAQRGNYVDDYYDDAPRRSSQQQSRPQAPSAPRPTPVPILKQINRHNEDGSYTYGYEGADGSFKIETKLPTGEVMGKYGYVDDVGKVRVVEYGANKYGFQPAGEGITVAPPTLVDETTNKKGETIVDDGQYYEEVRPRAKAPSRPAPQQQYRPAPPPQQEYRPAPQQEYRPAPQPQQQYRPAPQQFAPAPAPRPQPAPQRVEYVQEFVGQTPSSRPHGIVQFKNGGQSTGPAPPRAVVPGAAPVFQPAPVYEEPRPAPQRIPVPQAPSRPRAPSYARSSSGILDQLERDYALPQGSAPSTHDISFGSY